MFLIYRHDLGGAKPKKDSPSTKRIVYIFVIILSHVQKYDGGVDSCLQDKRASGFQRFYHVTDPFIKRLGLEAELQVSGSKVCVRVHVD